MTAAKIPGATMNKLLFIMAALALSSCSTSPIKNQDRLFKNPAQVEAYLKKSVDAKTLKNWDNTVSDDTILIDITIIK